MSSNQANVNRYLNEQIDAINSVIDMLTSSNSKELVKTAIVGREPASHSPIENINHRVAEAVVDNTLNNDDEFSNTLLESTNHQLGRIASTLRITDQAAENANRINLIMLDGILFEVTDQQNSPRMKRIDNIQKEYSDLADKKNDLTTRLRSQSKKLSKTERLAMEKARKAADRSLNESFRKLKAATQESSSVQDEIKDSIAPIFGNYLTDDSLKLPLGNDHSLVQDLIAKQNALGKEISKTSEATQGAAASSDISLSDSEGDENGLAAKQEPQHNSSSSELSLSDSDQEADNELQSDRNNSESQAMAKAQNTTFIKETTRSKEEVMDKPGFAQKAWAYFKKHPIKTTVNGILLGLGTAALTAGLVGFGAPLLLAAVGFAAAVCCTVFLAGVGGMLRGDRKYEVDRLIQVQAKKIGVAPGYLKECYKNAERLRTEKACINAENKFQQENTLTTKAKANLLAISERKKFLEMQSRSPQDQGQPDQTREHSTSPAPTGKLNRSQSYSALNTLHGVKTNTTQDEGQPDQTGEHSTSPARTGTLKRSLSYSALSTSTNNVHDPEKSRRNSFSR